MDYRSFTSSPPFPRTRKRFVGQIQGLTCANAFGHGRKIHHESLSYTVHIKGDGTEEQFAEIHEAVMATSPNLFNIAHAVSLKPTLVVE